MITTTPTELTASMSSTARFSTASFERRHPLAADAELAAREVINRKNARLDRLADIGSFIILACILASVMSLGIWLFSALLVQFVQFDIAEAVNLMAGANIIGR